MNDLPASVQQTLTAMPLHGIVTARDVADQLSTSRQNALSRLYTAERRGLVRRLGYGPKPARGPKPRAFMRVQADSEDYTENSLAPRVESVA